MDTVLKAARAETAADHGESGEGVAGVYNLNYDAPSMGESLNPDRSVLGSKQADIGARKLAGLCDGLQATHAGDPHMVVSGHSYGSTVAGKALRQTTAPDDFIAYGSPGFEAVIELGAQYGSRSHKHWRRGRRHGGVVWMASELRPVHAGTS